MLKAVVVMATSTIAAGVAAGCLIHETAEGAKDIDAAMTHLAGYLQRGWASVEANPVPVLVALGTFLLTIVYHKAKGRSFAEAAAIAATRVAVVEVPTRATPESTTEHTPIESPVVVRAKARATVLQLEKEHAIISEKVEVRLSPVISNLEKETIASGRNLDDATRIYNEAVKRHNENVTSMATKKKESEQLQGELKEIEEEMRKLVEGIDR